MSFVHLHTHSHYTFLGAIPTPTALIEAAAKAGMSHIAITDSNNVCGIVEAFEAAEKSKINLIAGAEVWTIDEDQPDEHHPADGVQLVLLIENDIGWKNLCELLTIAHRQRHFTPRIRLEQLAERREGLIVLTGGRWGLFRNEEKAASRLQDLIKAVGKERIEVEVVDLEPGDMERNDLAIQMAKEAGLPIVATNDVRYLHPEESAVLESMIQIGSGSSDLAREATATDQATLKTLEEMKVLFPSEYLDRTHQIASRCSFSLQRGTPHLPQANASDLKSIQEKFPPPKDFPAFSEEHAPEAPDPIRSYFRWLCRTGLKRRLEDQPWALQFATQKEYEDQLEFEIEVIETMDYVVYHMIVAEFCYWAKDHGIAVGPGRGSAAGSVVVWALKITEINPKQFELFFERFLNPERRGLPDIDVDFEQERREEVIAHVRERYGEACVGQILTIGKIKARASIKDSSRVCHVRFDQANSWSDYVDNGPKSKLSHSLAQGYLHTLKTHDNLFRRVADIALSIEGKPRQQGVHAAGVIIASDEIQKFCPLHHDPETNVTCTGLDMEASEKVGLVKFDFLGLKTLDVIETACKMVKEKTGSYPQIVDPLFDDPEVFALLRRGETEGLFQIESAGMTRLLRRLQPDNFEEIICMLALYRPGPLQSGMVDSWVERKHGRQEVVSVHPLLDQVLKPTYGLIVYQEQALATARVLAGFSLGQADLLRRAIGKKKAKEMEAQRGAFVEGCQRTNGISEEDALKVFSTIEYFSGYSFNKAHSAAYAVITYQTAKLKAHHFPEFMAAAMSLEMGNHDKIRRYASACRRQGIPILRPDLERSNIRFHAEDKTVRTGLGAIKGIGPAVLSGLMSNRPYSSFSDLKERSGLSKAHLDALVWAGATDSFIADRNEASWRVKFKPSSKKKKKESPDQMLLFGGGKTEGETSREEYEKEFYATLPVRPTSVELAAKEVDLLGMSIGAHPLMSYSDVLRRTCSHTILEVLATGKERTPVVTAGRIDEVAQEEGRHGEIMLSMTIEDGEGSIHLRVRSHAIPKEEGLCVPGRCILVRGSASARDDQEAQLQVDAVESLDEVRLRASKTLLLHIEPTDRPFLSRVSETLESRYVEEATHEVFLKIGAVTIRLDRKILPDASIATDLERILGRPSVLTLME